MGVGGVFRILQIFTPLETNAGLLNHRIFGYLFSDPILMLYEKRTAPDNWVPPDFLTRLQKNVNLRTFDISTLIIYSGLIFQHLLFSDEQSFAATSNPLRTGFIILVFSSSLAPVLHSLLGTVSTDTIHAMTFVFLLLNFVSLPYANGMRICRADGTSDSNTVSVATGFLASLCMSSRLAGPKETFLLIIFATLNFATWSTIRHQIQARRGSMVRLCFTIGMGLAATLSLSPFFFYSEIDYIYKRLLAVSMILSTILINFGFPFLFYKMQSTKANINGPWDEAIIQR
nr:phosphatidylinositol [Hymenolepis microstoma]